MATIKAAKHDKHIILHENGELVEVKPTKASEHDREHDHHSKIKNLQTRLDRRSAKGVSGNPKKNGKGGQYTWNGPTDEASLDDPPVALDRKDPNYVDEEEEEEVVAESDDKKAK
jgi:hypothetical protein